jgi:hypothetical protein
MGYKQITIHLNYEHEVRRAMIKILRTAGFLLFTAVATPTIVQDFDKGLVAY